jgi:hypothetical protein
MNDYPNAVKDVLEQAVEPWIETTRRFGNYHMRHCQWESLMVWASNDSPPYSVPYKALSESEGESENLIVALIVQAG